MFSSAVPIIILAVLVALALGLLPKLLRKFSGSLTMEEIAELKRCNALVLDVRTRAEYSDAHVAGSLNIPLNELPGRMRELDLDRPILACCASGVRSAQAKQLLEAAGFPQVYNLGSWRNAK